MDSMSEQRGSDDQNRSGSLQQHLRKLREESGGEEPINDVVGKLDQHQKAELVAESFRISRGSPDAHLLYAYYLGALLEYQNIRKGVSFLTRCFEDLSDDERIKILQLAPKTHKSIFINSAQRFRNANKITDDKDTYEIMNEFELRRQLPNDNSYLGRMDYFFGSIEKTLRNIAHDEKANVPASLFEISSYLGLFDGLAWYSDFPENKKELAKEKGKKLLGIA